MTNTSLKLLIDTGQMFTVPSVHCCTERKEDLQRLKCFSFDSLALTELGTRREQLMHFCTVLTKESQLLFR